MGIWGFLRQHALPAILAIGAAIAWALDMIGRAQEVIGLPGWLWQAAAGGLIVISVLVFFYQVHKRVEAAGGPLKEVLRDDAYPTYEGPHERLMNFVVEHIFRACYAREQFHDALITALCPNGLIAEIAKLGATHHSNVWEYRTGLDGLDGLHMSPVEFIPFSKMIESVAYVEKGYQSFLLEADRFAQSGYVDPRIVPHLMDLWEAWRIEHNAMVASYDAIKIDSRMGQLFRPARESRWGGIIPPAKGVIPLRLLLRGIEPETPL